MLLTNINIDARQEHSDPDMWGGPSRLSQERLTVKLEFVVEHTDPHQEIAPTPESVIELIQGCKTPASRTDSSSGSSEEQQPPNIVVSLRPQLDGAPSAALVTKQGVTNVIPYEWVAIAPSGELVHLSVGIEVRASTSPAR